MFSLLGPKGSILTGYALQTLLWVNSSVPDKRGVSGQKPDKVGNMTRQNKWSTCEDLKRSTSIDPSKFLIDPLPL